MEPMCYIGVCICEDICCASVPHKGECVCVCVCACMHIYHVDMCLQCPDVCACACTHTCVVLLHNGDRREAFH